MPRKSRLSGPLVVALLALLAGTHLVAEDAMVNIGFFAWLGDKMPVKNTPMMTTTGTVPKEAFAAADDANQCVQVEVNCDACAFKGNKPVKNAKASYSQVYTVFGVVSPEAAVTFHFQLLDSGKVKTGADGCARWTNIYQSAPTGKGPGLDDFLLSPPPILDLVPAGYPESVSAPPPSIQTMVIWKNGKKVTQTESQCDSDQLTSVIVQC